MYAALAVDTMDADVTVVGVYETADLAQHYLIAWYLDENSGDKSSAYDCIRIAAATGNITAALRDCNDIGDYELFVRAVRQFDTPLASILRLQAQYDAHPDTA